MKQSAQRPTAIIGFTVGCVGVAVLGVCLVLLLLGVGLQAGVLQAALWGPATGVQDVPTVQLTKQNMPDGTTAVPSPIVEATVATKPLSTPPSNQTATAIVVDNTDPGFRVLAGTWGTCAGTECGGMPYGSDFQYADPEVASRARFELTVSQSGTFDLYAWWPRGDDRAIDTPFTIQAGRQVQTIPVNQRDNGNGWYKVLSLEINAGETVSVMIGGSTSGYANADAIALAPAGSSPPAEASRAQSSTTATVAAVSAETVVPPTVVLPTVAAQQATTTRAKIIFLHHSTGQGIIQEGGLRERLTALGYEFYDHGYNDDGLTLADGTSTGTNFAIPDDNTNPDGFAVLFAQPVHSPPDNAFSRLLQYDVIAFKSCFPVSSIESNEQLEEYKTYYRGIRNVMDQHRDKLFVVITQPPLVPRATNREAAARARTFANWLKSPEYLSGHPNIVAFDLFQLLAEDSALSSEANMLRAAYRGSDPEDSHPNERANQAVAPQLADFLDRAVKSFGK